MDALYDAAIARDADAIAELEEEANGRDYMDYTILHTESRNGNTERVRFILREFANKDLLDMITIHQHTALHLAINGGHTEVAEVLIDAARRQYLPVTYFHEFLRLSDENMDTALHAAVMAGNVEIVKLLVEADPSDRHTQNKKGKTPMYLAVEKGFNDIVEIISTTCTAPSWDGPCGSTALRITNLDQVKSSGGTLYKIMDRDALYAAAIAGDADAISNLEMRPDGRNDNEKTILHIESQNGNIEHVRFILREFANKNFLVKLNIYKQTAFHLAVKFGHTKVAEILLDAARHLPSPSSANHAVTPFQAFLRQGDEDSNTALHTAVRKGHLDVVKLIVEADSSDRHIQNNDGETPIYIAVYKGFTDIMEMICTTCTAPLNFDGPGGTTALHAPFAFGSEDNNNIEVLKLLIAAARRYFLSSSDNNNSQNPASSFQSFLRQGDHEDSYTALHVAVLQGNLAAAKLLLEADPSHRHLQSKIGETPIYIAAENGHSDIVKAICATCTTPSLDGPGGSTALHAAIKNGNHDIEVVEVLIGAARLLSSSDDSDNPVTSFQAFLRKGDEDLNTALHIAVMQGNLATAKLLVEADRTDSHTQNNEGKTPMYIASESGHLDIVKMICLTSTVPFNLAGPDGTTALHAAIKNLHNAKEEEKDVIRICIDAQSENLKRVVEYGHYRFEGLFNLTDECGCTILELAVERNYVDLVTLIIERNPDYQTDYSSGFISLLPLIYNAIDKGYKEIVKLLTHTYEARDKNYYFKGDAVELISAIKSGKRESAFSLLDKNPQHIVLFNENLGWTALHQAAYHEFDSIIHVIVQEQKIYRHSFEYKCRVSTPFHVAAQRGFTSTVILLLQLWPTNSSAYTDVDKNGQNILHLGALKSKTDMIQGILKYCPPEYKKEFVNKQDNNGNTPLHILILSGCLVPELLRYEGLDMTIENKKKWTAPDMLYFEDEIRGDQVQIKIALDQVQIDHKSNIFSNSVLSSKRVEKDRNFKKQANIMINEKHARMKEDTHAIANSFAEAIAGDPISKAALGMKADTLNADEKTILHIESIRGDTERVQFIVTEFADKNLLVKVDRSKQTALHLAAHHEHAEVVKVLIDAARHLSSSSANEDTHTPVSCFGEFITQAIGPTGNTALHLAVLNCNVAIVKLLVLAYPNVSHVKNNEGKTPIYIAAENGFKDIVKEICTTCTALSLDGPGGSTTALHAVIENIDQEQATDVLKMMVNKAKGWRSVDFEALFCKTDEAGRTVLQLAVEKNYVDGVRLILEEDPACQSGRPIKRNGLMLLIFKAIDNEYDAEIVKLLSRTYNVDIDDEQTHVLALILAIQKHDEDCASGLLGMAKHLVSFADDEGWTPLHYGVYHEFESILDAIINLQKEVGQNSFVYKNVATPFHVAVKYGYTSTLLRLMELWPPLSPGEYSPYTVVNEDGQNILHLAAAADNRKEMVHGILKYCPGRYKDKILKQKDKNEDTPVHLLFAHGCFIPGLTKHEGLDSIGKNKKNFTPRDMLYVKDDIVGDQVHISIELDDVQTNKSVRKFWGKRTERKTNSWKTNKVTPSRRRTKDGKFDESKKLLMEAMHEKRIKNLEKYKMRTNTQIIVTALITTVAFTVGFTMPGGLYQSGDVNEGLVVFSRKTAFNVFMVSDALALLLSTSSLFFYFLESMTEDPNQVSKLNAASTVLNIVSIIAMMLTFIAGTYVVLSHSPALAITVSVIGSLFFLLIIVLTIKMVYNRRVKRNED